MPTFPDTKSAVNVPPPIFKAPNEPVHVAEPLMFPAKSFTP